MPITSDQYWGLQWSSDLPSPGQLFDYEVETLVANHLARYRDADPLRRSLATGLFLFAPTHARVGLDLEQLVSLVELDGHTGVTYLDPQSVADVVDTPSDRPYLMLDIDDGALRLNTKPSKALVNIRARGRSPYTVFEGVLHALVFPWTLRHHFMDLAGSRYKRDGAPILYTNANGQAELGAVWSDDADPRWGTPSCGARITA